MPDENEMKIADFHSDTEITKRCRYQTYIQIALLSFTFAFVSEMLHWLQEKGLPQACNLCHDKYEISFMYIHYVETSTDCALNRKSSLLNECR